MNCPRVGYTAFVTSANARSTDPLPSPETDPMGEQPSAFDRGMTSGRGRIGGVEA